MTPKERVVQALELKEPDLVPVFEWDINKRVVKAITGNEDILQLIDQLDIDGIVVRPDYRKSFIEENVFIDEWGCKRKITGESIAVIIENPIKDIRYFNDYEFPDPSAPHRYESLERAVRKFGDRRAVILNVRDIFSDIRDLLGYENALVSLITERDYYEKLLNRTIAYNRTVAQIAHKRYGIDIVATTDDIADRRGLIFHPKIFFEFLGPKFREVIKGFKDIGMYSIKHCDGNILQILDYMIDCGIDCIDPIDPTAGMEIGLIKEKFGRRVCIKGNINCVTSLVSGTVEDIENEVKACIEKAAYQGGYILSSSNMIHSGVKPQNFKTMVQSTRKHGKYPLKTNPNPSTRG